MKETDRLPLPLFHGTSDKFARHLLSGIGSDAFPTKEAVEVTRQLYRACMSHVGSFPELAEFYLAAGSQAWSSAPIALQRMSMDDAESLFSYGSLYAALNSSTALRYACRSPYGSELLWFFEETVKALEFHGDRQGSAILANYPGITGVMSLIHTPVVLRLEGLKLEQLSTEMGNPGAKEVLSEIETYLELATHGTLRVCGLQKDHVVAVYQIPRDAVGRDPFSLPPGFLEENFEPISPKSWLLQVEQEC